MKAKYDINPQDHTKWMQYPNSRVPLQALFNNPTGRQAAYTVHFKNHVKEQAKLCTFLAHLEMWFLGGSPWNCAFLQKQIVHPVHL